jgi:hypothetical protein
MTQRVLGPTGSPRRRWTLLVALTAVLAFGLFYVAGAQAVHDDGVFELDTPSANAQDGIATTGDDWDNVCASNLGTCTFTNTYTPPGGSTADASSHENDGSLDATIFHGGGSKDPEPIANWLWKDGAGGLPDKDNLLHAYAARYDDVIYFGSDRYANDGDATQAFWFLQNEIAADGAASQGGFRFTGGGHRDGDVLIISEFSNGGTTSTITVYKWAGNDATGSLQLLGGGDDKSCGLVSNDPYCGIVNTATDPTLAPWVFTDKAGSNDFRQGELYEAGIDLGELELGGSCFSTFVAETRSSTSTTATLKDFVLGGFEQCGSTLVTTPKNGTGGNLSADTDGDNLKEISIGTGSVQVKDSAQLTVTGISSFSGTLSFYLCGPIANPTACNSGGVSVAPAGSSTVTASGVYVSNALTVTSVGRYCWYAFFDSGTDGVPDASDGTIESAAGTGECFEVMPVTPTLDTQAVASPVNFGQAVQDNATLGTGTGSTPTAKQPGTNGATNGGNATYPSINATNGANAGGKITFTLLKSDCSTLATGTGTNPQDYTPISGDGTYGPVGFTPDAPGTYHWKAQYVPAAGDPNNLGSTHNASCNDTDETVVVNKVPTSIQTAQWIYPNDDATISATAGGDLVGTLQFRLYDTMANCLANGATGKLYEQSVSVADDNDDASGADSETKSTSNTSVKVISSATVYWRVLYTSTNSAHEDRLSNCTENTQVTFTGNNTGSGVKPPA